MIDAYTIGIRLALTDDLSRGLGTIQRMLGALDGAVSRSGAGLRALGQLGTDMAPPDFSRPDRRQPGAADARLRSVAPSPAPMPVRSMLAEAAGPHGFWTRGPKIGPAGLSDWTAAARLLRGHLPDRPEGRRDSRTPRGTAMQHPDTAAGMPATWAQGGGQAAAIAATPPAQLPRPRREGPARADQWVAAGRAPYAAGAGNGGIPAHLPAAPPNAGATFRDFAVFAHALRAAMPTGTDPGRMGRRPDDAVQGYAQAPRLPPGSWDAARPGDRTSSAPGPGPRAVAAGEAEAGRGRPAALSSVAPRRGAVPPLPAPRDRAMRPLRHQLPDHAGARGPDATQPRVPDPTGTSAGELILDGTRFGRLICDRLARHIDHPRSGLTGADPRLTPTWPGAAWS